MNCCDQFKQGLSAHEIARFDAFSALFDRVKHLPGDIVELGVASGSSLRMWIHLVDHQGDRLVWGFDTFAGFPSIGAEDGEESIGIGKRAGGETEIRERPVTREEVQAGLPLGAPAILVAGDIVETLLLYVTENNAPISPALVLFDADLYAPTKVGLERLWPLMPSGGICIFDEYGHPAWPGETKAVDEFIAAHDLRLERLDHGAGPSAVLTK